MIILIIDDEKLARSRLINLLSQIEGVQSVVEASSAIQALDILEKTQTSYFDAVLLDIQMPGMDGMSFARTLQRQPQSPALIFVTAHPDYACHAFDLEATDYLTKPVRLERLQQALRRAMALRPAAAPSHAPAYVQEARPTYAPYAPEKTPSHTPAASADDAAFITLSERGRIERITLSDILYCKAEQKYVTLHLSHESRSYDGTLSELEAQHPHYFLRVHRNTLVAYKAIRALEKSSADDGSQWVILLHGTQDVLPISRRLLPAVKAILLHDSDSARH